MGTVKDIHATGMPVAPHLSFGTDSEETIRTLLLHYQSIGVSRVVALRGDLPSGAGGSQQLVFANELVEFIRQETGEHFTIEVAAYPEIHPEAKSYDVDIINLKRKLDAGADAAITQYFFSADAYLEFVKTCREHGITKPIYPGIMPITNYDNLARFSRNCGADIPRWLDKKLSGFGEDLEALKAFGQDFISDLCKRLIDGGAPGLHFYTMNQAEPVVSIVSKLKQAGYFENQ
jgi:methylenetetrahydrofolate reductase (NADPH)